MKNVAILEGLVSRTFTDVEKISVKEMDGSDEITWVPEDEVLNYVDLKTLNIKKNGTYKAASMYCDGFNKVKVNVSADVDDITITENGTYNASDDDLDGYSSVTVNVPSAGGGVYTVTFLDDNGSTIKTMRVEEGEDAWCLDLDGTTTSAGYFKGWNPSPKNVRADITCRPVRGAVTIQSQEITDSWDTICANKGAGYPLGAYKELTITVPAGTVSDTLNDVEVWDATSSSSYSQDYRNDLSWINKNVAEITLTLKMIKVAEGEDGTTSSWVSELTVNTGQIISQPQFPNGATITDGENNYRGQGTWEIDGLREYLNSLFFNSLPNALKENIKPVHKTFKKIITPFITNTGMAMPFSEGICIDKIWVPSMREMLTIASSATETYYSNMVESQGIDYTKIFTPPELDTPGTGIPPSIGSRTSYIGNNYLRITYSPYQPSGRTISYSTLGVLWGPRVLVGFCL